MTDIWLSQTTAQVAVQRALTSTPTATIRHGTVTAIDYGTFIHELQLDEPGNVTTLARIPNACSVVKVRTCTFEVRPRTCHQDRMSSSRCPSDTDHETA
jgi:hypothetical protein